MGAQIPSIRNTGGTTGQLIDNIATMLGLLFSPVTPLFHVNHYHFEKIESSILDEKIIQLARVFM